MTTTSAHVRDHELNQDEIIEGLIAANGCTAGSIDLPQGDSDPGSDSSRSFADSIGAEAPTRHSSRTSSPSQPLLHQLDDEDRTILQTRFGQELAQAEIGTPLDYSQMHIPRILSNLRAGMLTEH